MVVVDVPIPEPGPGQVLVRVDAIGINYIDTYFRRGLYPRSLPYIPGDEGSGVVHEAGPDVTAFAPGDRIAWAAAPGSYAEFVVVDASSAISVPDGVPADQAASALLQGMTAHYLIESTYPARSGDTVLVHAGAGGVGLLLTQMAVGKGVRVITTVSTDAKAERSVQAGAAHVLRYDDDIAAQVRELTAARASMPCTTVSEPTRSRPVGRRCASEARWPCSVPRADRYRRSTHSGSTGPDRCF